MENRTFFKDMEIGRMYGTTVLLTDVKEKVAKTGNVFLEMALSDGEDVVTARLFNNTNEELSAESITVGTVVNATIRVNVYNSKKNYIITNVYRAEVAENAIKELTVSAPIDSDNAYLKLQLMLYSTGATCTCGSTSPISHLAMRILMEHEKKFTQQAAAKAIHHGTIGGLLQHTATMAENVSKICETYPELDEELLLAGVALHDIGKIREMNTSEYGTTEYTTEGRLLGHSAIGVMMVEEETKKGKYVYDSERVKLLEHMIASHHGSSRHGAIVEPAIPEAVVLHALDMIDSKTNVYEKTYSEMKPGELSGKVFGLNGASIYKALEGGKEIA